MPKKLPYLGSQKRRSWIMHHHLMDQRIFQTGNKTFQQSRSKMSTALFIILPISILRSILLWVQDRNRSLRQLLTTLMITSISALSIREAVLVVVVVQLEFKAVSRIRLATITQVVIFRVWCEQASIMIGLLMLWCIDSQGSTNQFRCNLALFQMPKAKRFTLFQQSRSRTSSQTTYTLSSTTS